MNKLDMFQETTMQLQSIIEETNMNINTRIDKLVSKIEKNKKI
jgi:hypothetical protein